MQKPEGLLRKKERRIVLNKRARLFDVLAICTVVVVLLLDRWTKSLILQNFTLYQERPFPMLGDYLVLKYIRNYGAAFGMLNQGAGSILLAILIGIAILVVGYMYARMLNSRPFFYKIIFGLIIGGAVGNLLDRAIYGGYVVDFVSFRIPALNFYFAIFNVADACISVGVCLLFILVLLGRTGSASKEAQANEEKSSEVAVSSGAQQATEQDA